MLLGTLPACADHSTAPNCEPDIGDLRIRPEVRVCDPGEQYCRQDNTAVLCTDEGVLLERTCPAGYTCAQGACRLRQCEPGEVRCEAETRRVCSLDGLSWAETPCAPEGLCLDGACVERRCVSQILLVVDSSASVHARWTHSVEAVRVVLAEFPNTAFGLVLFPVYLGCALGDGSLQDVRVPRWPTIPVSRDSATLVAAALAEVVPGGYSPVSGTLEWLAGNPGGLWRPDLGPRNVILITDGVDTCRCAEGDAACARTDLLAAASRLRQSGTQLIVVAYEEQESAMTLDLLSEAAGAGGTFIRVRDVGSLDAAVEEALLAAKGCR